METTTNGISQGDFTTLRVPSSAGVMTDILTLIGSGGGGGSGGKERTMKAVTGYARVLARWRRKGTAANGGGLLPRAEAAWSCLGGSGP